jgi:hypothetical protein
MLANCRGGRYLALRQELHRSCTPDGSRGGLEIPGEEASQTGLADPVRADKARHAGSQREGQIFEETAAA